MYSEYISEVMHYKKIELNEVERSFLFRIITGHDQRLRIASYLKLKTTPILPKEIPESVPIKLEELALVEKKKGVFLSYTKSFNLTTFGLFYILYSIRSYPPQFLIKYQDNPILKSLLFQFFETNTIKASTARFYTVITQYLYDCCNITLIALDDMHSTNNEEEVVKIIERLDLDLNWHSKNLAFKLAMLYSETSILTSNPEVNDDARVTLYELENKMRMFLSKDEKFINLLKQVKQEFLSGFDEITNLNNN